MISELQEGSPAAPPSFHARALPAEVTRLCQSQGEGPGSAQAGDRIDSGDAGVEQEDPAEEASAALLVNHPVEDDRFVRVIHLDIAAA